MAAMAAGSPWGIDATETMGASAVSPPISKTRWTSVHRHLRPSQIFSGTPHRLQSSVQSSGETRSKALE
eukprot:2590416-Alexandrium_andersonii.AAC.1